MQIRSSVLSLMAIASLLAMAPLAAQLPDLFHQEHSEASPILADYDFEQPSPSGPDTFWVRQPAGGEVALSTAFRFRGERSLHISEVPGNRDFAEFLAYFEERGEGDVFIQFYLLLTDVEQRFNFGLAGRNWFLSPKRDGHAVWLQTADGVFRHHPHDGWEDLFAPRPFAWYFIDLVYQIERGTYDLAIYEEGLEEPMIDRHAIAIFNGHSGSSVKYFSLIGDLEDAGRFDFFVDDLLIATDPAVRQRPFVAPGRRRFFVDMLSIGGAPPSAEAVEDLLWQARAWLDQDLDPTGLDRLEAAGEAAFHADRLELAADIFERLLDDPERRVRALLKLSDVHHQRGDVPAERSLRESIYGSLDFEESPTP